MRIGEAGFVAGFAGKEIIPVHALGHVSLDGKMMAGQAGLTTRISVRVGEAALIGQDPAAPQEIV